MKCKDVVSSFEFIILLSPVVKVGVNIAHISVGLEKLHSWRFPIIDLLIVVEVRKLIIANIPQGCWVIPVALLEGWGASHDWLPGSFARPHTYVELKWPNIPPVECFAHKSVEVDTIWREIISWPVAAWFFAWQYIDPEVIPSCFIDVSDGVSDLHIGA